MIRPLLLFVCLGAALPLVPASLAATAVAPLPIFVSVPPLGSLVERVGADRVSVRSLVSGDHDPHTFEPHPSQIGALSQAKLFVGVGVPFEQAWLPRIKAANASLQMLDARDGIATLHAGTGHGHAHGHGHEGDGSDPHVWTDPMRAKQLARAIRDRLRTLDPEHAGAYDRNFDRLAAELDELDSELRALLRDVPRREFLVFHPAWGYFAETYGLVQVPIEVDGKIPGAKALAGLVSWARQSGSTVVFVQPQSDRRAAERIAADIGGRVVVIDPLSSDYFDNLRRVARHIAEALGS